MSSATALALVRGPLIGTFLGLVLYGVTCMQAFFYFQTYVHDTYGLKLTVALLVILETIHAAMTIWVMDDYLIVKYANEPALVSGTWWSASTYIVGLIIDFFVYLYFTWRIWLFTKKMWIVVFMCSLSVSRTAISIVNSVFSAVEPTWEAYLDSCRTLNIVANILFIVGDTFSAGAMAYQLNKFKSWAHALPPDRPRRINILLNRLLIFSVATGALTSLVDVIALILTLRRPKSLDFLSAVLVQTRLYANSLLASLNIRNATSRAYDGATSSPIELPAVSLQFAHPLDTTSEDGARGHAHEPRKSDVERW